MTAPDRLADVEPLQGCARRFLMRAVFKRNLGNLGERRAVWDTRH
jgi:hypothetical protein